MNLYCIKCSNFTKYGDVKMKKLVFILSVLSVILKNWKALIKKN